MSTDHSINSIEVNDVSFSYGNTPVLENVSLTVHKGDYLGIIGPNGGGKTTLLKIMLGLLIPQTGTVKLFGTNRNEFKQWQKIGYVPQKAVNFDSHFPATVYEVAAMGRIARRGLMRSLTKKDHSAIQKALEEVEMAEHRNTLISDLSGGQQQRIFIARALAAEPEIIFLDEPTVGVDVHVQQQFYHLLKKLNRTLGITLVLVSHDIDVVAHEATEVACVNRRLVYDGDPKHFLKTDALKEMYGEHVTFVLHNHP